MEYVENCVLGQSRNPQDVPNYSHFILLEMLRINNNRFKAVMQQFTSGFVQIRIANYFHVLQFCLEVPQLHSERFYFLLEVFVGRSQSTAAWRILYDALVYRLSSCLLELLLVRPLNIAGSVFGDFVATIVPQCLF